MEKDMIRIWIRIWLGYGKLCVYAKPEDSLQELTKAITLVPAFLSPASQLN